MVAIRLRFCWMLLAAALPMQQAVAESAAPMDELLAASAGHRVLLIGEIHGTGEVPALVADLADSLAAEHDLLVGLELPRDEQKRIDAFLDSAGTGEDRAALLTGKFWTRDYQDGRSSAAMLELLERLRQLRLRTKVEVLALDQVGAAMAEGDARDRAMAERLSAALEAHPKARALVLAGNFHTRLQKGAPWDESHEFLGYRLSRFEPYAIEIMGVAGGAWICTGAETDSCKARDFPESSLTPGIELSDEVNERGHQGMLRLERTSASPPAWFRQSPIR
jgi:erythromycin esterase-like protein